MMDNIQQFIAGFQCSPPEYLPECLKSRLTFISCLSHKQSREVYLTTDTETGGKVIIKITEPDSPDNVKREYELLSKLNHSAIPKALFYHRDEDDREYLLREYMPGETLDFLLERDGVFAEHGTLETVEKLCEIISYLHRQSPSIVYRDLKPQNIIMTPNGKVSLIDFGISKEENKEKNFDTISVGSTAFAAPELFGFTKSDSRTDIFMLGRLALYLNTGNYDQHEAISQVKNKSLLRIIKKCTELSPEKRYASVEKLAKAIGRVLNPPSGKEIAAGIIAAALCLGVGLYAFTIRDNTVPEPTGTALVGAGGTGYEQEVQIPVHIETLWDGEPFSDCAVAVDNHHWYEPASNGTAELYAFAYDEYKIRAVTGNRTAFTLSAVTKDTVPLSFTFDLSKTPEAPEYVPLSLPFGQAHEIPLNISGAESVTFAEKPEWIAIMQKDGEFYLLVSEKADAPGHYYLYAEAVNAEGKADIVISLFLEEDKPVTVINTAEELDKIRENLSGCYALGADIDLGEYDSWTPIGTYEAPFTGVFDGRGYCVNGLRIQGNQSNGYSGLFGVVSRGVIRNTVIRGGVLFIVLSDMTVGHGFIAGRNGGLIENCAVFDSALSADIGLESGAGGICGINQGVIKGCFNEADVTIFTGTSKSWTESCAGGVAGVNNGYLADCGNAGAVTGISLAGGVAGFNDMGILTRCYNTGYVKAPAYFDSYLSGGISHLLGRGKIISYCAFETGTAQVGSNVFNGGTLLGIVPAEREVFRDLDALNSIFHAAAGESGFIYASVDTYYPIPAGILTERTATPLLPQSGLSVRIDSLPDVKYFYTTDGSDPHMAASNGTDSVNITLKTGQTLKVFAAMAGYIDSDIAEYKAVP